MYFGNRHFGTVDTSGIDILGVDILGVDITALPLAKICPVIYLNAQGLVSLLHSEGNVMQLCPRKGPIFTLIWI